MGYTSYYDNLFQSVGQKYGIDPNLLKTIAIKESSINAGISDYHNSNGTIDVGMMQINSQDPEYAKYGYNALKFNPSVSVEAAAQTLQDKTKMLQGMGEPVTPFNLFHAYNGWSNQGLGYASEAMRIYNGLGANPGLNTFHSFENGSIGSNIGDAATGTTPNYTTISSTSLLSNPMEIVWLLLGLLLIGIGLYVLFNPFANLSSIVGGLKNVSGKKVSG